MSLPFHRKASRTVITLDPIPGIEGSVHVTPWTVKEFEDLGTQIEGMKTDGDGMNQIKQLILDRVVNPDGTRPEATIADLDEYEAPTIQDLFGQILARCGFAKREDLAKN